MKKRQIFSAVVFIVIVFACGVLIGKHKAPPLNPSPPPKAVTDALKPVIQGSQDESEASRRLKRYTARVFQQLWEASHCVTMAHPDRSEGRLHVIPKLSSALPNGVAVPYEIRMNKHGRAIHVLRDIKAGELIWFPGR